MSLRNVASVHVLAADQLNTYDVLASDHVVFTEQALSAFLGTGQGRPPRPRKDAGDQAAGMRPSGGRRRREDAAAKEADAAQDDAAADEAPKTAGAKAADASRPRVIRQRAGRGERGGAAVSVGRIANPRDILLKPVISEKSYRLADDGKYTFIVAPDANKTQIRQAVEAVFTVRVTGVNTSNRPGKRRRTKFGWGKRPDTKRAIVSLAEGDRIDLFGPVS